MDATQLRFPFGRQLRQPNRAWTTGLCKVAENCECNQSARDVAAHLLERHYPIQQALLLTLCGPPTSTTVAIHGNTNIRVDRRSSSAVQMFVGSAPSSAASVTASAAPVLSPPLATPTPSPTPSAAPVWSPPLAAPTPLPTAPHALSSLPLAAAVSSPAAVPTVSVLGLLFGDADVDGWFRPRRRTMRTETNRTPQRARLAISATQLRLGLAAVQL
ncbi:hypothetical protein BC832DRAFT_302815 [Gaertneriomyces semiglobifer]|nr:hypothetical protein BC832DRAFT_302815 [Gaertneriomyces semiglobifer]